MDPDIFILIGLLIISAIFSASETAMIALSEVQVRTMASKGGVLARLVAKLKQDSQSLLITILIACNFISVFTSVYSTVVFANIFKSNAIGITAGIVTIFMLVFGEILPKSFASKYPKIVAYAVSPLLIFCYYLFYPLVKILTGMMSAIFKLTGKPAISHSQINEDELKAMISISAEGGAIPQHEQEFIQNVLELDQTTMEEVMTNRTDIIALEADMTVKEASEAYSDHLHSRVPVYKDTIDNIIGILSIQELFAHFQKKKLDDPISKLHLMTPIFVPETQKAHSVVREFQKKHVHMAIVVDEHGVTSGLVTLEDLLEEIVGEISDEHDVTKDNEIKQINKDTWLIDGSALIEHINEVLEVDLEAPDHKSLSFFILNKLSRFPRKGEKIEIDNLRFSIQSMSKRSIGKVKITKKD